MCYCCFSLESACSDNALYPATVVNMPKTSSQGSVCMTFSFIQKRVYKPRMLAMPPWKAIAATRPDPSFGKPCKMTHDAKWVSVTRQPAPSSAQIRGMQDTKPKLVPLFSLGKHMMAA